jgi:hypothetical protein
MENPPPPKGRGCFFYGCITTLVLLLVGALTTYLGARYFIKKMIATYTDSAPALLPEAEVSTAKIEEVRQRWVAFFDGVKTDKPLPPFALTADDLNALIASTGANGLSNRLHVKIEGDRLKGQMSIPLRQGMVRGRYLNGEFTLKVNWNDGALSVWPESITVRGKPLPAWLMGRIRQQNLARDMMNNMNAANTLQNLESVAVTNDAVVIQPKAP